MIIDNSKSTIIALECTTKPPKYNGDFVLDWQYAGLKYKTVVKSHKILYLQRSSIIHRIGILDRADIAKIIKNRKPRSKSEGCYIATAIYGSFDCPQVWVLRRYRDFSLSKTWYGRGFIKLYYAISPTIVRWFGENKCFHRLLRNKLDKFISKLIASGY
ncbi:hypothetical protein LJC20_04340 [Eubacteriales bacterium OttesenSCG-928-M02]|nr:hypothetical protein [Eubacteriales bacterium OttesenSCG-928-M02]